MLPILGYAFIMTMHVCIQILGMLSIIESTYGSQDLTRMNPLKFQEYVLPVRR